MSKPANTFLAQLADIFRSFGEVRAKPMFGGHGLYHQDVMIGLVADDTLYLKVDAETKDAFAAARSIPFEYIKNGRAMKMSYFSAPEAIFDDPDSAKDWADKAYAAALRSRRQSGKRKPPPRSVR